MKSKVRLVYIFSIYSIALPALWYSPPAIARELIVDASGEGEYRIIQEAIDAASPGDIVRVKSGRYRDYSVRNVPGHDYGHGFQNDPVDPNGLGFHHDPLVDPAHDLGLSHDSSHGFFDF